MNIIVSGMIAGTPYQGGASWAVLQYILGLKRLGHQVYLIEPIRADALQPRGAPLHASVNADYFRQVVVQFGLEDTVALLQIGSRQTVGVEYARLEAAARSADVLINISGMLTDANLLAPIPRRVFLDLDPAFIQLWHTQGINMHLDAHTHFVTVAQAMGRPTCRIPTCGREWITTRQPIVLEQWQPCAQIQYNALTTIANWRGYGSVEHEGMVYGQKAHSLRAFFELPRRTRERFMLALSIHPDETKDLDALRENGWELDDPARVAATPNAYRDFIGGSKAEFGIAKSGYVLSRSGWFSDRSICYLASGKPVIAQDTGWSEFLPQSGGLFAFQTIGDVLDAIERMNRDYARHARAARQVAEDYFDSDRVLTALLDRIG